jgi:hypothetical protein
VIKNLPSGSHINVYPETQEVYDALRMSNEGRSKDCEERTEEEEPNERKSEEVEERIMKNRLELAKSKEEIVGPKSDVCFEEVKSLKEWMKGSAESTEIGIGTRRPCNPLCQDNPWFHDWGRNDSWKDSQG